MVDPAGDVLEERLLAVHRALDAAGFDHAIGGAIALAVHVREPRFTADIDLNVLADPRHPAPLLRALPPGMEVPRDAEHVLRRDGQIRVHWPAPPLRTPLDLFLPQDPEYHQLVTDRAILVAFGSEQIKVLQATDLMVFKMLFNRTKDWADIEAMIESGAGDVEEAGRWVTRFLGADDERLERLGQTVRHLRGAERDAP